MPLSSNAAFAGLHEAPDGSYVTVAYCTASDNRKLNQGSPRGHLSYMRFGWYWWASPTRPRQPLLNFGPFTSSRLAYQDAMAQHRKRRA